MRPATSTANGLLPALLAAAVVSIVVGIVGMHALNTHGIMSGTNHASMTSPMTGQMIGSQGYTHAAESDVTTSPGVAALGAVVAAAAGGTGHGMRDMVMLCVAMLAAAAGALALLLLLSHRRTSRVWAHLSPLFP